MTEEVKKNPDDGFEFSTPFTGGDGSSDRLPTQALNTPITEELLEQIGAEIEKSEKLSDVMKKEVVNSISAGILNYLTSDTYRRLIDAPENGFTQRLDVDGSPLSIQIPKIGGSSNGTLSGKEAINFINSQIGGSSTVRVPCWNSGILLLLGNFRISEFLNLIGRIIAEKHELGEATRGALFSGDDVAISMAVVDFALEHTISANVKYQTPSDLKSLILTSDIPTILAGVLTAYHPKGYPLIHTCIASAKNNCDYGTKIKTDPETGKFKYHDLLDFRKTVWVDGKAITMGQRRIFTKPFGSVTEKEIKDYQTNLLPDISIGPLNDTGKVLFTLIGRHPTLAEYQVESNEWISDVISHVNGIMGVADDHTEASRRKRRIEELNIFTSALGLQRNAAWIKSIRMDIVGSDDPIMVEDMVSIKEVLAGTFGLENSIAIEKGIDDFKGRCTISVTGIPNFKCPNCGSGQTTDSKYPSLIPLNMVQYFFTIGEWMRSQIAD